MYLIVLNILYFDLSHWMKNHLECTKMYIVNFQHFTSRYLFSLRPASVHAFILCNFYSRDFFRLKLFLIRAAKAAQMEKLLRAKMQTMY